MTIILDENLPRGLLWVLAPRAVTTVQEVGYAGVKNGQLLALLEYSVIKVRWPSFAPRIFISH